MAAASPPPLPAGACDCHVHIFGPPERYKGAPDRTYDPRERSLAEYEALAARLGLSRVVFVQPSGYGTDNASQLDALRERPETARAVIVIGDDVDAATLKALDAAGVCGVRLNLMTPRPADGETARRRLEATARLIAPLGWHIQVYASLEVVGNVAPHLKALPVPVVFDHLGGATRADTPETPGFAALLSLVADGTAWVKLSGADIATRENADFTEASPFARALLDANDGQLVWGSDWPHLVHQNGGLGDDAPPAGFRPVDEGSLLAFLAGWAGSEARLRRVLVDNPARLYRF